MVGGRMLRGAWLALALLVGTGDDGPRTLAQLEERLEEQDPEERRAAVRALGRRATGGDEDAWPLVLRALADPEGQVADAAQLVLGELDDEDVAEDLCGRAGLRASEPLVRRRAAEALGRVDVKVPVRALARGLGDRDAEVRRRVLWSIERLGRARIDGDADRKLVPGMLRRWKGDREDVVRAAALLALARIDPPGALELAREGLEDRREVVRLASLSVLGRHEDSATELVRSLVRDESPRVRSELIEVQEALATRDAAKALVVVLEAEERKRLRWSAVEALRRLSGMRYRTDPRPWRLWSERLDRDWRPARAPAEPEPVGGTRAFGGVPLLSDRVAFLIDLSGSLWRKREDGTTRKELAETELARALSTLPPEARFNVIPYTDRPFPFEEELVPATPRNVERALEYFADCTENGRGNFFGAALHALTDPEVDTVMTLTDGAPTGGEVWSLDLIVPLLLERNRFTKVRFDTILVDAPRGLERHWNALAEGSGGRCRALEVP